MMPTPCLHCKQKPGTHARGLCSTCHRTPGVRDGYAVDEAHSTNGGRSPWEYTELPPPPEPTSEPPGSPGKQDVMAWRDAHGYQPHHPDDAKPADRRIGRTWEAVVGELATRMEG
jgi:hypothetical protein